MWEIWPCISAVLPEPPVWDSIQRNDNSKEIPMDEPAQGVDVKISDEELKGRYSNLLRVTHTREEFILDFINLAPPQGIVTARVVSSPGHVKRIIQALQTNLAQYEKTYGVTLEAPAPAGGGADGGVH